MRASAGSTPAIGTPSRVRHSHSSPPHSAHVGMPPVTRAAHVGEQRRVGGEVGGVDLGEPAARDEARGAVGEGARRGRHRTGTTSIPAAARASSVSV